MIFDLHSLPIEISQKFQRQINLCGLGISTSEVLAAQIVGHRSKVISEELAIICMQELSRRRKLGEDFDFETFIEEEFQKIPQSLVDNKFLDSLIQKNIWQLLTYRK